MKASLVLVTSCSVLFLGGLAFWLLGGREAPGARISGEPVAANPGADAPSGELLARVDALSREIDDLRAEIATMRAGAARQPAIEVAGEKPLDEAAASFAALHRDAILKVIDEDRQEQKQKQEDERRARDLQTALSRAERAAKQVGLLADQQKQLADVFVLERQKLDDLRNQARDPNGAGADPQAMRAGYRDVRAWRLAELTNRFGADLGAQIDDADNQRNGAGAGGRRGNRRQGRTPTQNAPDAGAGSGGGL